MPMIKTKQITLLLVSISLLVSIAAFVFIKFMPSAAEENLESKSYENTPAITADENSLGDYYVPEITILPKPETFTMLNAGDFLTKISQYQTMKKDPSGLYQIDDLIAGHKGFVEDADLALCHLEILEGPDGPKLDNSGKAPVFSSPPNLISELKKNGWDGCSAASNHSLDGGMRNIEQTISSAEKNNFGISGIATKPDNSIAYYTLKSDNTDLTIANISFTWSTNLIPKPAGKEFSVNTFSRFDKNITAITAQAEEARANGADIVALSIHCCQEYITTPDADQIKIAQLIADSGAIDIYIGHHPHVPQPIVKLESNNQVGYMWTAYSLGNHINSLPYDDTAIGILALSEITKDPTSGKIEDITMSYTTVETIYKDGTYKTVLGGTQNPILHIMAGSDAKYFTIPN